MNSVLFLRLAAVLTFIHAAAHTIGGVFGKTGTGAPAIAVQAMKVNRFLLMGNTRSYWDFYRGLGLAVTICLTAEAVMFWQMSSLAKSDPRRVRPLLVTFLMAYIVLGLNSEVYFFQGQVINEVLIAACLGLALVTASSRTAPDTGSARRERESRFQLTK